MKVLSSVGEKRPQRAFSSSSSFPWLSRKESVSNRWTFRCSRRRSSPKHALHPAEHLPREPPARAEPLELRDRLVEPLLDGVELAYGWDGRSVPTSRYSQLTPAITKKQPPLSVLEIEVAHELELLRRRTGLVLEQVMRSAPSHARSARTRNAWFEASV